MAKVKNPHFSTNVDESPVTIELVQLTGEDAKTLLENNKTNRPVKGPHVTRLADAILNGDWRFLGDPVRIDQTGQIADGQHRLLAIVQASRRLAMSPEKYPFWSGKELSLPFVIIKGIDSDACDCFDTGIVRSGRDVVFRIRNELFGNFKSPKNNGEWTDTDFARMSTILQTAAKCVYARKYLGTLPRGTGGKFKHDQLKKILDEVSVLPIATEMVTVAHMMTKEGFGKLNLSYLSAAIAVILQSAESQEVYDELVQRINKSLQDCTHLVLKPDHPFMALRQFNSGLSGDKTKGDDELNRLYNACVKAVEYVSKGTLSIATHDLDTKVIGQSLEVYRIDHPSDKLVGTPERYKYNHCGVDDWYTKEEFIQRHGCSIDDLSQPVPGFEEQYERSMQEYHAYLESMATQSA